MDAGSRIATPIPLDRLCAWAQWNGRTHGLKMHVVYDPGRDHPRRVAITPATVVLVALLLIAGTQLTLFAMWFDMESNKDLR